MHKKGPAGVVGPFDGLKETYEMDFNNQGSSGRDDRLFL